MMLSTELRRMCIGAFALLCVYVMGLKNWPIFSGVFKGRRARHLPWAPLFGGPLEVLHA